MSLINISKHGNITPTTLFDVCELDKLARDEDRREVEDISHKPLITNLLFALEHAKPCLTARTHFGELYGIFGVLPSFHHWGAIAFIGTKAIEQNTISFLRGSKDVLNYVQQHYDMLCNIVDARNEVHVRWLKWLGFSMIRRLDNFGAKQIQVLEFAKASNDAKAE